MPLLPSAGSIFANTFSTPATLPFVTQVFVPLNLYTSPSRIARACIPAASEPAAGSVRQNAPSVSPVAMRRKYFFFCASVPNSISGACTAEFVTPSAVDIAVNTRATSSSISTYETASRPGPLFRHQHPAAAHLAQLLDGLRRKFPFLFHLLDERAHLRLHELADGIPYQFLMIFERKIHRE